MALMQRAGTGRLKHVQIKQFFLQNLLRAGIFTVHKINTKVNPGDLNTKRLSGERRKFLGRLNGLFMAKLDEENDDNEIRRLRRINQVTKQQCARLIQMAAATFGISAQLKGCNSVSEDYNQKATLATVADSMVGLVVSSFQALTTTVLVMCRVFILAVGVAMLVASVIFIFLRPLTWTYSIMTRWLEVKYAAKTMGLRHRLFIYPSLQLARWLLGCEIKYLHERFQAAGQRGGMMVDIETIYSDLKEYLGGERIRNNPPRDPIDVPMADANVEGEGEEEESGGDDPPDDDNGDDIVNMALNGYPLNGQVMPHGTEAPIDGSGEDVNMDGEAPDARRARYMDSSQDKVSEPDEWAILHDGHMDQNAYERMVAFSRANQIRLARAARTLQERYDAETAQGNWEETANCLRALHEVEALMDIA
jgi:hypothetical protein